MNYSKKWSSFFQKHEVRILKKLSQICKAYKGEPEDEPSGTIFELSRIPNGMLYLEQGSKVFLIIGGDGKNDSIPFSKFREGEEFEFV